MTLQLFIQGSDENDVCAVEEVQKIFAMPSISVRRDGSSQTDFVVPDINEVVTAVTGKTVTLDPGFEFLKEFDFMETFNACEPQEVNDRAVKIAEKYDLPGTGGSDAHKADCVGLAYTEVPDDITCESDLIAHVIKGTKFSSGGSIYTKTTKEKIGKAKQFFHIPSGYIIKSEAGARHLNETVN